MLRTPWGSLQRRWCGRRRDGRRRWLSSRNERAVLQYEPPQFRFNRGRAVTVDSQSDAYVAQKVASAASTRNGELPLLPLFGTEDPEFSEFDAGGMYYTCAVYFPEVKITEIQERISDSGRSEISVRFDILREDPNYGYA
jgi:hypothetical protein